MGLAEWQERNRQRAKLLLEGSDPVQTRADLATFFGPRAEIYLRAYDKSLGKDDSTSKWAASWSWPGFLLGFVWFFYRRLYLWGAAFLLLPIVIGILFPSFNGGSFPITGLLAKDLYVNDGLRRIRKADTLGLQGTERDDYLRRAGGVSLTAGILAGILYVLLIFAAFYEIASKIR